MDFCHIVPTAYLDLFARQQDTHLVLAHLVESDHNYRRWHYNLKSQPNRDDTIIMDNSAFEMYKQGKEMLPAETLMALGRQCNADYIVMTDYPDRPAVETINMAKKLAPEFHANGFGTFFVPQSEIGNTEDLIRAFAWAAENPDLIDYVGVSILAVPNAYGVEQNNKLQRMLARWKFMHLLDRHGILTELKQKRIKVHMLGMVDGPNEIALLAPFIHSGIIDTWDSSAAVWAGLNGIEFDSSPTGLIDGKFEEEVNFNALNYSAGYLAIAARNIDYIRDLIIDVENGFYR